MGKTFFLGLFFLILPASSLSSEEITLLLKWRHQFQFAGVYAAQDQGYFEDAGLQVSLRTWSPGVFIDQELTDGHADYIIGNSHLLLDYAQGAPIVALATYFQRNPWALIFSKKTGITHPRDLKGRRIMYGENSVELKQLLGRVGLGLEDILPVPQGFGLAPLQGGSIEALAAYSTDAPYLLQEEDFPWALIQLQDYHIPSIGDTLFTRQDILLTSPAQTQSLIQALNKGWAYALDNPQEIIDLILTQYNPGLSRAFLEYEAREVFKAVSPMDFPLGSLDPYRWQRLAENYQDLGLMGEVSLKDFLYQAPDQGVNQESVMMILMVLVSMALLFVAFVIALRLVQKASIKHRVKSHHPSQTEDLVVDHFRHMLLGKLISPVGHELGTPLGISLTAQSNIKERLAEIDRHAPEALQESEYCQENLAVLDDLANILQENLTKGIKIMQSLKKTANLDEQIQDVYLLEMFEDIQRIYQKRLDRSNVILSWHVASSLKLNVAPSLLSTLLMSLLEYSMSRFDPETGPYTSSLVADNSTQGITLTYQDNGLYAETSPWESLQNVKAMTDLNFILTNPYPYCIYAALKKLGYLYTFQSSSSGFQLLMHPV
jgi:ABC-type nitrate/sulfonate/bicarbonate transport system substrate-binding protein